MSEFEKFKKNEKINKYIIKIHKIQITLKRFIFLQIDSKVI